MHRNYKLFSGLVLVIALTGCANTLNSAGETAKGAVHGTGKIIEGVGEGIGNIGQGIKEDLDGENTN